MEEERLTSIVVLAHPGSEPLVRDIWDAFCDWPHVVYTWPAGMSVKQLLEEILAGNTGDEIAQTFVVVPANLVPVTRVRWSELQTPVVDVEGATKRFWGRVPVTFDKDVLVDFLPENDDAPDEAFVRKYVESRGIRPLEVSHNFGNYYTKVLRGDPCQNVIIEAMIRKRFLYVGPTGWPAVTGLFHKLLKK